MRSRSRLGSAWWALAWLLGLALTGGGARQLAAVRSDVMQEHGILPATGTPITWYLRRDLAELNVQPGASVVLMHGFAGSREMMRPLALALARSGFGVASLDLPGHGQSRRGLAVDAIDEVVREAVSGTLSRLRPRDERLAVAGHSLGSHAALVAARSDRRVAAVVAISPIDGNLEPTDRFHYLAVVGGRDLERVRENVGQASVIEGRNHLSVLSDSSMHTLVVRWLSNVYEMPQSSLDTLVRAARAERPWITALLGGAMLAVVGVAGFVLGYPEGSALYSPRLRGISTVAGAHRPLRLTRVFVAYLAWSALALAAGAMYRPFNFLGVVAADHLALYFFVVGVGVYLSLYYTRSSGELLRPALLGLLAGLHGLAVIGFAVTQSWTRLVPEGERYWIGFAAAAVVLPFSFMEERVAQEFSPGPAGWLFRFLSKSVVLLSFVAALMLPNPPGLLLIVLPVLFVALPAIEILAALAAARSQQIWGAAFLKALLIGWLVATAFPLI